MHRSSVLPGCDCVGSIRVLGFGATLQQHAYLKFCSPPQLVVVFIYLFIFLKVFRIDHQYGFDRKCEGNEWVMPRVSCRHTHSHTGECETSSLLQGSRYHVLERIIPLYLSDCFVYDSDLQGTDHQIMIFTSRKWMYCILEMNQLLASAFPLFPPCVLSID